LISNKQLWVLILSLIFFSTLMYVDYIINKNEYLQEKVYDLDVQYNASISTHQLVSDLLVEKVTTDPKVSELLYNSLQNPEEAGAYREKLYSLLQPYYSYLKSKGFNVFHFHDTQGKSFLRFHKPKKYGDSLLDKRPSIKKIIKENKKLLGFEIGVFHEEFRYMYPLFHKEKYVGSVEISTSPNFIVNTMNKRLDAKYTMLSKHSAIEPIMLKEDFEKQYSASWIEGYYINNDVRKNTFSDRDLETLEKKLLYKLAMEKPIAIASLHWFKESYIYTFIPLLSIDNSTIGYIVSEREDNRINNIANMQIIKFIFLSIFILIGIFVYRKVQKSQHESEKILEQYKYVMDQFGIVSKADRNGIITYVNQKFCDVSGYNQDELIGNSHNIVRHTDMKKPFFKQMWKTLLSKKVWNGVIKNRTKSGKDYYVQSTIAPILNDSDEILEFIALRQDITEIIFNKNELESEKNYISMLFDAIDEIILVKNNNNITQINQKFFDLFAYKNIHEFKQLHSSISELFISHEGYLDAFSNDWFKELLDDGAVSDNKVLMKDKYNEIRTFRVKIKKVPHHKSYSYLIILNDISLLSPLPINCLEKETALENHEDTTVTLESTQDEISINYEALIKRTEESLGLSSEIVYKLLDSFIVSTQKGIEDLNNALKSKNWNTLERIAHNIKGSSSTLHLKDIANYANKIELHARNNDTIDYQSKIDAIANFLIGIKEYRDRVLNRDTNEK